MARKDDPQSFEKTSYSDVESPYDVYRTVAQIVSDKKNEWGNKPSHGFIVKLQGKILTVTFMSTEIALPRRIKEVELNADKAISEYVKVLKAEFKKRTGDKLALKELKDERSSSSEKVSANDRYYYRLWRLYTLDVSDVAE